MSVQKANAEGVYVTYLYSRQIIVRFEFTLTLLYYFHLVLYVCIKTAADNSNW
jgi:hypothetical protein